MTQVFDPETGAVTPVTVIAAGPCPVVQVKTRRDRRLRRRSARLRRGARRASSPSPSSATSSSSASAPHRTLVEFRGGIDGAVAGETVTVELFEPGDKVKVSGIGIGKGFQGTIKRHNFSSGPRAPRLAQRPRAGLDRRLGDAVARLQGHQMAGPDGRQARHPARPHGPRRRPRANLLLVKGSVPGPKNGLVEVRG